MDYTLKLKILCPCGAELEWKQDPITGYIRTKSCYECYNYDMQKSYDQGYKMGRRGEAE